MEASNGILAGLGLFILHFALAGIANMFGIPPEKSLQPCFLLVLGLAML